MSVFKNLIGKRINAILMNSDQTHFAFRTVTGETYNYCTAGDCCNTVYVNHFSGAGVVGDGNSFDLLRGAVVLSAEDKEWRPVDIEYDDESWAGEVVEDGFFTIVTDRGYIDIEVRNEHNGYYSGRIEHIDEVTQEAVEDLRPLQQDF